MSFERTELKTDRLLLRLWCLTDIDDAYAYVSDPEWGRYLWNTPYPYAYQHAEQFVTSAATDLWETQARFAVEHDERVVGGVRLYMTDAEAGSAGMGYNLSRAVWSRGFATEAAAAVLAYAFDRSGLQRVFATVDVRNLASMRVLEKLGMKREGVLRRHRFHRGEHVDEVYYGILREEWPGR